MHAWKVIDSLVGLHAIEPITLNGAIIPENIPILFFTVGELYFVHFGNGAHHWIVTIAHIYHESTTLMFVFLLFCFLFEGLLFVRFLLQLVLFL